MTARKRPAIDRAVDEIEAVRRFWYPIPAPARTELDALSPDLLQELADDKRMATQTWITPASDMWQDNVDDEVLCEHGHVARLCLLCPPAADTRAAAVDEEVDRRSDAAADRADTMIDRYDPDDREPAGGDPYWSEEPTWDD